MVRMERRRIRKAPVPSRGDFTLSTDKGKNPKPPSRLLTHYLSPENAWATKRPRFFQTSLQAVQKGRPARPQRVKTGGVPSGVR